MSQPGDEMRVQYDFSKGVRGKYSKEYAKGTNIIVLDPDLRRFFPDSKSVNEALRVIARIAAKRTRKAS
jgi:hypothetical protein